MEEKYLIPNAELEGWRNPKGLSLYSSRSPKGIDLNPDGGIIFELCNGKKTISDIIKILQNRKNLTNEDIEKVRKFIYNLVNMGLLYYIEKPVEKELSIPITGEYEFFHPIHCTIELCDICNLRCSYCYRESSPLKKKFLKNPIEFLTNLYKRGIRGVELSGGEPLLHPQIYEILEYSCRTFTRVALLTNGLLLSKDILKLVEPFRKKFSLQVSIPSLRRNKFLRITGVDVLDVVLTNLHQIKEYNIGFRIVNVLQDEESIEEISEFAHLAKSIGAFQFVSMPFLNFGRAKSLFFSHKGISAYNRQIEILRYEFPPGFLGLIESEYPDPHKNNCGAGSQSLVFDPEGKPRPCPFAPLEFTSSAYNKKEFRNKIAQVISPRETICGNCEWLLYCKGCIIRGWFKFKEIKCQWGVVQKIEDIFGK